MSRHSSLLVQQAGHHSGDLLPVGRIDHDARAVTTEDLAPQSCREAARRRWPDWSTGRSAPSRGPRSEMLRARAAPRGGRHWPSRRAGLRRAGSRAGRGCRPGCSRFQVSSQSRPLPCDTTTTLADGCEIRSCSRDQGQDARVVLQPQRARIEHDGALGQAHAPAPLIVGRTRPAARRWAPSWGRPSPCRPRPTPRGGRERWARWRRWRHCAGRYSARPGRRGAPRVPTSGSRRRGRVADRLGIDVLMPEDHRHLPTPEVPGQDVVRQQRHVADDSDFGTGSAMRRPARRP